MRPLRILHLRDTHEIGGPGKTILETHRAIDRSRFALHLAVFQTRLEHPDTPFVTAARDYGLPVHHVRSHNQYDPRMIWRVATLARELKVDILHAHEVKSDVIAYLASCLTRVAVVTTIHGWIGNRRKDRALIALDRRVLRRFDRVIAVSRTIHDRLIVAGVRPQRLRLLHNAVVLERYRRTGQSGYLDSLLGSPVVRPVLTSIGRLSREKGQADLLDALALVAANGCRFTAVLAGDGPERLRLLQKTRELGLEGRVYLPGHLRCPERVLEESDLMVLPSHTEGLPNAALEALAMEVPVLATRVGGTPEVVLDGDTGRLIPPGEPSALAAALMEFYRDPGPWKAMACRGRARIEREFNFQARTRRLETIYEELARELQR